MTPLHRLIPVLLAAATAGGAAGSQPRCHTDGLQRVALAPPACCADLPCQKPFSLETVPPPRHAAHT